jgi:hypothetical protein
LQIRAPRLSHSESDSLNINVQFISAILRRDAKDATYKFALLRALVQTVTEQRAHHRVVENRFAGAAVVTSKSGFAKKSWDASMSDGFLDVSDIRSQGYRIASASNASSNESILSTGGPLRTAPFLYAYPLGLLVWYWLQYYYPIFAHSEFIPQKNGESERMEKGRTLAIRHHFLPVIAYYAHRGGFAQLYFDVLRDQVPADVREAVLALMRSVRDTVVKMPMQHMGFSVFKEPYSLVRAEKGRMRGTSYHALLRESGTLYIHPELHEVIDALGGLLVGDDSIVSGWASFTAGLARRAEGDSLISEEAVLSVLRSDPVGDRDVVLAKKVLESIPQACVWSGMAVNAGKNMHIDHMLPFSLARNNGLWNLVPVSAAVNLRKSDKIPAPELVVRSSGRIMGVWEQLEQRYEALFWQEAYEGLGVAREVGVDGALQSLQHRCTYLIDTRGLEVFRG